ncbi:MAG: TetR/AcrR family transcriptional regulator [Myxococcales bacterium]|nr:TetR/AcrR family transcriptional regulator [Myxococcales bacterium]
MARKRTIRDEDLLAAARACFVDSGFAVPTKEIARRAGVSEGLLFQRYGNKAELFFAAMVPPPSSALREQLAAGKGDDDDLIRLGLAMRDYFREAADVLLPLLAHPHFTFEDFAQRHPDSTLAAMRREAMAYFAQAGALDSPASALLLMSSVFGVVMFEKLGAHNGEVPNAMVRRMLQRIRHGSFPEGPLRRRA